MLLANARVPSDGEGGLLLLRLQDFPVLKSEFGSVRVGTSKLGSDSRPLGLFPPILIHRVNNEFYALDAACTHEGCTVRPLDPVARVCPCPCHGSLYRPDGTVERGPARFPLRRFVTRFAGEDELAVELPDVSFALKGFRIQAISMRIRLEFIAFEGIEYEVRFRRSLSSSWSGPIAFSLAEDGPLDQTVVLGRAHFATVYVEAVPGSLYAVAMRTGPV